MNKPSKTLTKAAIVHGVVMATLPDGITATETAKVVGPLFSQEARGQFGKSIVFGRRLGSNVVRGYTIPNNPNTPDQVVVRVSMAATGIVTRQVKAQDLKYNAETDTVREHYRARTRNDEVWNSALVREMQGPNRTNYTTSAAEFAALPQGEQDAWSTAAKAAPISLPDYSRGTDEVDAGFMLFLLQKTIANAGYGDFDPTTPNAMVAG